MKTSIPLLLFLLSPVLLLAQSPSLPLGFNSYAIKLSVSKEESLVLTTRAGEVGMANSVQAQWKRADSLIKSGFLGPAIEHSNFFNKDTGLLSGFIQGSNNQYNIIYRTTNGGRNWERVDFGQDGWVDDAIHLDDGRAWLSVAGKGIAYTTDFGSTWKKLPIPGGQQRYISIFFNAQQEGLIGSLENSLAYTKNNCATWQMLPSPLDQKRYTKTYKIVRPEIGKVAIYGDYFLVKQEELVFISRKDSINWTLLKEYDNFYTDPQNSALYFKTPAGRFVKADKALQPVYVFENTDPGFDRQCKNGKLFIVTGKTIEQLGFSNEPLVKSFLLTGPAQSIPESFGYCHYGAVGISGDKLYYEKNFSGKWEYLTDLPFSVKEGRLSVREKNTVLFDRNDDSLFYFNIDDQTIIKKSKSAIAEAFSMSPVSKIIFASGSWGCFHNYRDELIYKKNDGVFEIADKGAGRKQHRNLLIPDAEDFPAGTVDAFAAKIPQLFDKNKPIAFSDYEFTEAELARCKKDILDFKASLPQNDETQKTRFGFYKNNIDFNRLISRVDSLKELGGELLNGFLMNLNDGWSTTTNWIEIQLVNEEGQILTIKSQYYEPNALYFPWIVETDGYRFISCNYEINKFINAVYPSFLKEKDRVKVLHKLVKDIY